MEPIELGLFVVILLGLVVLIWYGHRWARIDGDERSGRVQGSGYSWRTDDDINGGDIVAGSGGDFGGGDGGDGGE